jgi:hypothetical protein
LNKPLSWLLAYVVLVPPLLVFLGLSSYAMYESVPPLQFLSEGDLNSPVLYAGSVAAVLPALLFGRLFLVASRKGFARSWCVAIVIGLLALALYGPTMALLSHELGSNFSLIAIVGSIAALVFGGPWCIVLAAGVAWGASRLSAA